jgi:nitroreductase
MKTVFLLGVAGEGDSLTKVYSSTANNRGKHGEVGVFGRRLRRSPNMRELFCSRILASCSPWLSLAGDLYIIEKGDIMDAIECIKKRMSIRAFKPERVPKDILMEVVNIAKWSPSYKNSQPWEVIILSGAKKEALSKMMVELLKKGVEPAPDLPRPQFWPSAEEARINHLYKTRAEATGIDLKDPEVVRKSKEANFNFYYAPHAIYLFQDSSLTLWSLFDIGLFAQSLMLAAHAKGLGTVPQAFSTDYAKQIKNFLSIPETKRLVIGISIGYPDLESPINKFRTDRVETEKLVSWLE